MSKSQAEKKEDLMRRNSIDGSGSMSQKSVIGIGESDTTETGSKNEVMLTDLILIILLLSLYEKLLLLLSSLLLLLLLLLLL